MIFVLGAPGSGKGKHSDHLVAKFGGCHVSVGEILREVRVCALRFMVDGENSRKVHRYDQEALKRRNARPYGRDDGADKGQGPQDHERRAAA